MSTFEYLSVLVAIIVGIGIAHLLLSLGRILGEVKDLNVSVIHLIWTANALMLQVVFWWWGIGLMAVQEWAFHNYLLLLLDASLMCLLAALLFPVTIPAGSDLGAHLAKKRKPFFSILILLFFVDPAASMVLGTGHLLELGWAYVHALLVTLVGGIAAIRFDNARLQLAVAIYWGLAMLIFIISFQFSVST